MLCIIVSAEFSPGLRKRSYLFHEEGNLRYLYAWAAAPGGGRGDRSPANFSTFNIMPMGGAWKESTSNGPRPPNRRAVAPPLLQGWINDSRGGGTRPWGPSRKRVPKCLKGPKTFYTTITNAEKQSKKSKKGPFSLYLGSPGSHPRTGINEARRGRSLPVPPPPRFSSHALLVGTRLYAVAASDTFRQLSYSLPVGTTNCRSCQRSAQRVVTASYWLRSGSPESSSSMRERHRWTAAARSLSLLSGSRSRSLASITAAETDMLSRRTFRQTW